MPLPSALENELTIAVCENLIELAAEDGIEVGINDFKSDIEFETDDKNTGN